MGKVFSKLVSRKKSKPSTKKEVEVQAQESPDLEAKQFSTLGLEAEGVTSTPKAGDATSLPEEDSNKPVVVHASTNEPKAPAGMPVNSQNQLPASSPLPLPLSSTVSASSVSSSSPNSGSSEKKTVAPVFMECRVSLQEYEQNAIWKPTPGLLFKDVKPFQPLSPEALVNEEIDSLSALATRLRDLHRTLQYDMAQLASVSTIVESKESKHPQQAPALSSRLDSLSQQAMGTHWARFQGADKEELANHLSRLTCDERLEILAIFKELQQQFNDHIKEQEKNRQRARRLWRVVKAVIRRRGFRGAQESEASASSAAGGATSSTTSGRLLRQLAGNAQQHYQEALLLHDRCQGWARLLPPTMDSDKGEEKGVTLSEKKHSTAESKESQPIPATLALDNSEHRTPSAFAKLREDLSDWLGLTRKPPLVMELVHERLLAIQDYCQLAHRVSECVIHLQHERQLARQVVAEFKSNAFQDDSDLVQAVCQLAAGQDPELLRALLNILIDSIKASSLLQIHVLQGLAAALHHCRAEDVSLGDLGIILQLLVERTNNIGSDLPEADVLQLLQTLGAALSMMALISKQREVEQAARAKEAKLQATSVPSPASPPKAENLLLKIKHFLVAKKEAVIAAIDGPTDDSGLPTLTLDAYENLCAQLSNNVIQAVQSRYGNDLNSKNPDVYFTVLLIRQALMRITHKEQPRSEKLIQGARQFFSLLESVKDTIKNVSIDALFTASKQLVEFVGSTPLGDKIKDLLTEEEERAQPWFEHFLVLKTLVSSSQLSQLETVIIQGQGVQLTYPLFVGVLQLLDNIARVEGRVGVGKAALQFLNLFVRDEVWKWPTSPEFVVLQSRLQDKCKLAYAVEDRLTLEQRQYQQNHQRSQLQSQARLRSARRYCQETDLAYHLHDYCLSQVRQAQKDQQWLQDNSRYIPALAKVHLYESDDTTKLFYPVFNTFLNQRQNVLEDKKSSPSAGASTAQTQSTLLIMGDAGTGKSLFIRRNHLLACARYISRQFDRTYGEAAFLGSVNYPLSFFLYLNQSPVERPLEQYLQQQGFTEEQIRQLKGQAYLLVYLDGYDEWSTDGQNPRLFAPKILGGWASSRCKIIVTCRSQYLQGQPDYRDYFTPPPRHPTSSSGSTHINDALAEWIITCLDEGGVAKLTEYYVKDEQDRGRNPWSQQFYLQQFKQSDIEALVRTPIILLMVLQVLPDLQRRLGKDTHIIRLDIYREFVTQYIHNQRKKKLERGAQNLTGLVEAAQVYAQELALTLFSQDRAAISYQPRSSFSFLLQKEDVWGRFFASDSPDHILAEVVPLRISAQRSTHEGGTVTQYSFIHKSVLDYFTALGLMAALCKLINCFDATPPQLPTFVFESSIPLTKSTLPWALAMQAAATPDQQLMLSVAMQWEAHQHYAVSLRQFETRQAEKRRSTPWNARSLNTEQSVIHFLEEILKEQEHAWQVEQRLKAEVGDVKMTGKQQEKSATNSPRTQFGAQLDKVVQASRHYPELAQASANAATLLNLFHFPLTDRAWQGVQLPGADLGYSVLARTNLSKANLQGVNFVHAVLRDTDLTGADLRNVIWGERPYLHITSYPMVVAYHPKEPWFAVTQEGLIELRHCETAERIGVLKRHNRRVTSLMFSYDGQQLVSGSEDGTVKLWDVATKTLLWTLSGQVGAITAVAFSSKDQIAFGGQGNTIRLFTNAGEMIAKLEGMKVVYITSIAFHPDGQRLAFSSVNGGVGVWDLRPTSPIFWVNSPEQEAFSSDELSAMNKDLIGVRSVVFSPNGRLLAYAWGRQRRDKSNIVQLWDVVNKKKPSQPLKKHTSAVTCLAFSPNSQQLISGSVDQLLLLWDTNTQKLIEPALTGHSQAILSVAFNPSGKQLVSGSGDLTVRFWDLAQYKSLKVPLPGHTRKVSSIAFQPNGRLLASASMMELSGCGIQLRKKQ